MINGRLGGVVGLVECRVFMAYFRSDGVVATISPVESTHVMRRQGAETHAIPPLYIRKSGRADIADVYIAGTHLLSAN